MLMFVMLCNEIVLLPTYFVLAESSRHISCHDILRNTIQKDIFWYDQEHTKCSKKDIDVLRIKDSTLMYHKR